MLTITTLNALYKLASFSLVLMIAEVLKPDLYPSVWAILVTSVVLTVVGTVADLLIVPKFGNLPSLAIGFFGITGIIWLIATMWPQANVSLGFAIVLAISIGPIEYLLHRFVLEHIHSKHH